MAAALVHCLTDVLLEFDLAKALHERRVSVLLGKNFDDHARCNCALAHHGLCPQRRWAAVVQLAQQDARARRVVPGG
jgi:hypothetical protein